MRYLNRTEIVVLLIIVVVGLALVVPWGLHSRESSRLHQCQDNLKKQGETLEAIRKVNKTQFPFGTMRGGDLPVEKRLAWTALLYAARNSDAKSSFDPSVAWDADPNIRPMLGERPVHRNALFRCPAATTDSPDDQLQYSSYVGMAGLGDDAAKLTTVTPQAGIWAYDRQTGLSQITDGTEHTICILETSRDNGPWTAGGRPTLRGLIADDVPILGPGRQFGGHHEGECQALYADGRVRRLNNRIDVEVLKRQATIAGEPDVKK